VRNLFPAATGNFFPSSRQFLPLQPAISSPPAGNFYRPAIIAAWIRLSTPYQTGNTYRPAIIAANFGSGLRGDRQFSPPASSPPGDTTTFRVALRHLLSIGRWGVGGGSGACVRSFWGCVPEPAFLLLLLSH